MINVDGHNFPNIPLMKLSAFHKANGDHVEWHVPGKHYDIVYMSKVFSFTPDYEFPIDADQVYKGGSGYCIELVNGREIFNHEMDILLPEQVEHIYPDYTLFPELTKDTAYGFMSRGCPRGCSFCHVGVKEGKKSYKVADLSEFWSGQKNVVLLDPNPIACPEWRDIIQQLQESGAWIDFSQGVDIRLMTEEKAKMLSQIKMKNIHFAWDRYEDKEKIIPKFRMFKEITGINYRKMGVFILCNFDTTMEQDLERIYTVRDLGYSPYVMLYDKEHIPRGHIMKKLQRWCNNRIIFHSCPDFKDYGKK